VNKADLARRALELRQDIGLDAHAIFDPYKLAEEWGIDVFQLSDLDCSDAALQHLKFTRRSVFSGALVPFGTGAVILENDSHDPFRRRSTAAHEMAHVVLGHPFTATLVNEKGCRVSDKENEKEAAELGGELLLSAKAAKRLAWQEVSDADVAIRYGVSIEIARWRMQVTGARLIAQRARAKRGLS
jgi:Zn-dependent peptidase ImmA (M78 family)